MLNSIVEIESFFEEDTIEFEIYERDLKTKRAVERNIEIIGEAMNRILQVEPDIALSNTRQMVNTRNRIIHGYDTVQMRSFGLLFFSIFLFLSPKLKIY